MRVVVPFDGERPKTRLASLLDELDRRALAERMLGDVLDAVVAAGGRPEVLSTAPVDASAVVGLDDPDEVRVTVDERPLTAAVNAVLADSSPSTAEPLAVVMADLALATPDALDRLFDADGSVVAAPGVGGGTNALVVRHPEFRVDYHGVSFRDHVRGAREATGVEPTVVDSLRLSMDVDEPSDLVEVLLHGRGETAEWLRDQGFSLTTTDGRVGVERR